MGEGVFHSVSVQLAGKLDAVFIAGLARCQNEHMFGWQTMLNPTSLARARQAGITFLGA